MIDLSRLPLPAAIEAIDNEAMFSLYVDRFLVAWAAERTIDPTLPDFNVLTLRSDPVAITLRTLAFLRLLDRQRVNDVVKALLAPLAGGSDLDNVAARQNVERLVIVPASGQTPAVLESDASLLRRYLLSFERASAGSRNRYLYEAHTAWPQSADLTNGLWDAKVNGWREHGRRGDTDIVIIGPAGRLATDGEKKLVRDAVTHPSVQPEAVAVTVLNAQRAEYAVDLVIEVSSGPDAELVRLEAVSRVTNAATSRVQIGGEIPAGYLAGAAYGASVIRVRDNAPVAIAADAYTVPVMVGCSIAVEVRT